MKKDIEKEKEDERRRIEREELEKRLTEEKEEISSTSVPNLLEKVRLFFFSKNCFNMYLCKLLPFYIIYMVLVSIVQTKVIPFFVYSHCSRVKIYFFKYFLFKKSMISELSEASLFKGKKWDFHDYLVKYEFY